MENLKRFVGKTALVTGAGSGIGRATAIRLASEGAAVAIHEVNMAGAEETVRMIVENGGKAKAYETDVTDRQKIKECIAATMEDFGGRIDILVNNAGVNRYKDFFDFHDEEWDWIIGVNLTGVWNYCRQLAEHMAKNGGGSIVNISSVGATMSSYMRVPYMSSKGGTHMLTQALAQDMGKYNVRVNAVAPGCIETEMTRPDEKRPGCSNRPMIKMLTAMHRYGKPEDIAAAVAFLASDDATYITGSTLTVDGGMNAGNPIGLPVLPVPDKDLVASVPWLDEFDYVKEYMEKCM